MAGLAARLGAAAEQHICEELQHRGYTVVEKNYHSRFGEIDVIAQNERYLCFVEVKCRQENALVSPLEAITRSKQIKILKTAQAYLFAHHTALQPRFDAAAVTVRADGKILQTEYIENAFGL